MLIQADDFVNADIIDSELSDNTGESLMHCTLIGDLWIENTNIKTGLLRVSRTILKKITPKATVTALMGSG